jgi:hypothetical protein
MSRKLNVVSAVLAALVLGTIISPLIAQTRLETRSGMANVPGRPTLACCKCLGGTNSLDLSTVSSNNWTVNNNPVSFLTALHQLWNINPGPAKWVSTVPTGSTGIGGGDYVYRLDFVVPACTIDQQVSLTGNYGGDDDVSIFLDNTSGAAISQCTGGWCFNTPHKTLSTFSTSVGSGPHALIVKVNNNSAGPSGMFVNAKLTSTCTSEPNKTR